MTEKKMKPLKEAIGRRIPAELKMALISKFGGSIREGRTTVRALSQKEMAALWVARKKKKEVR
jgi:MarR-like DNA-binding transcriptional regulator SgrR of sgrS sRNA